LPALLQIPKTTKPVPLHRTSGSTRYNLTFRRLKPEWEAQAPLCRCGRRAVLKAKQGGGGGSSGAGGGSKLTYYYSCDNTQGPSCSFWQASPHVVWL